MDKQNTPEQAVAVEIAAETTAAPFQPHYQSEGDHG
jgi:hypothetical protein